MKNRKFVQINHEIKTLTTWNEKFKYAVIAGNRLIFEEISGAKTSTTDLITCAELSYLLKPMSKERFSKSIKYQALYY